MAHKFETSKDKAGAGVPGLELVPTDRDFTCYIAYGDGLALYGSSTWAGEHLGLASQPHYGRIRRIGNPRDDEPLRSLARLTASLPPKWREDENSPDESTRRIGYRALLDGPRDSHSLSVYGPALGLLRDKITRKERYHDSGTDVSIEVEVATGWTQWMAA